MMGRGFGEGFVLLIKVAVPLAVVGILALVGAAGYGLHWLLSHIKWVP